MSLLNVSSHICVENLTDLIYHTLVVDQSCRRFTAHKSNRLVKTTLLREVETHNDSDSEQTKTVSCAGSEIEKTHWGTGDGN